MKRFLQYFVTAVCALALIVGIGSATMATASATTSDNKSVSNASSTDDTAPKSASTDSDDGITREESVTDPRYGEASFSKAGHEKAKAKLKTKSGKKIMLNVQVKPMTKRQTAGCWTVPVGTVVQMEGIWNGSPGVDPDYRVKAGDNTFCHKKGHGNQVFKKSCGNRAWGVPGGPPRAPKSIPRVRGQVVFADYYVYKVKVKVKETRTGSAEAEVWVYDDGRQVCHARSSLEAEGYAFATASVRIRARSASKAVAEANGPIMVAASSNEKLHGEAKAQVSVKLKGKVEAMCDYTPPEEPEPEHDKPSVNASANACVEPGQANGVITVVVGNPNDIDDTATVTVGNKPSQTVSIAAGATKTLTFTGFAPGTYGYSAKLTTANKSATGSVTVQKCEVPEQPVTGDVLCKNPPHLYEGGNGIMVCELSQSNGVKPTLSQFSVEALNDHAYFAQPTEFGWREEAQVNPCPSNVLCVRVQVWAVSPGLFKYLAKFASYDEVNGQFMIEEDDF